MAIPARYSGMKICVVTGKDGRLLNPIQQARVFAQHSRSPKSVEEIIDDLDAEKDEAFHEKWIVGFGHSAIAELATLPVDFSGVSMIAAKAIESWQRPGVCEKSTRMQDFSDRTFFDPFEDGPVDHPIILHLRALKAEAFALYSRALEVLPEYFQAMYPEASAADIKKKVFDSARYLLPAGTTTSLGICAYPRDIADMIQRLGGAFNPELRKISQGLKEATSAMGGPLIRHTEANEWYTELPPDYPWYRCNQEPAVRLLSYEYLAAFEYQVSSKYKHFDEHMTRLEEYMKRRPPKAPVPRIFRRYRVVFKLCLDYGAFRDLQRHRRMEQFVEFLTPHYGYSTPPLPEDFKQDYRSLMEDYASLPWPVVPSMVEACQYYLPMAFSVGVTMDMDLEELYYLVELRTQPAGHISYRSVAYEMARQVSEVAPWPMQWCRAIKP